MIALAITRGMGSMSYDAAVIASHVDARARSEPRCRFRGLTRLDLRLFLPLNKPAWTRSDRGRWPIPRGFIEFVAIRGATGSPTPWPALGPRKVGEAERTGMPILRAVAATKLRRVARLVCKDAERANT